MLLYLYGAISLGFAAIGLFFFKFWRATHEILLGAFALSSWLLGLVQILLAIKLVPQPEGPWVYLLQLIAFVIIAAAILAKNLEQ